MIKQSQSNSLYSFKARQRPCKARCGILAARKKDHGRALTCGTHFIHFSHNVFALNKRTSNLRTIEQNLAQLYADVHDDVAVRKLWVWCGDVRAFVWAFRL